MALSANGKRARQELQDEVASLTRARDLSERALQGRRNHAHRRIGRQIANSSWRVDDLDSTRARCGGVAAREPHFAHSAVGGDLPADPRVASGSSPTSSQIAAQGFFNWIPSQAVIPH